MELIGGDETKASLMARNLTFEQILAAPFLAFIPNPSYAGQMLLIVEIGGYAHAALCERRGDNWRIITAYPSRKHHKRYLS